MIIESSLGIHVSCLKYAVRLSHLKRKLSQSPLRVLHVGGFSPHLGFWCTERALVNPRRKEEDYCLSETVK